MIELNQEERQTLQKLAKARSSKRHEALRVRALSLAAEDRTNLQISAEVGLHYNAIGKTRARFVQERLGGGRKVRPHPPNPLVPAGQGQRPSVLLLHR
jgi:hypothetical protein